MRKGLSPDLIERVLGGAPKYTIAELEAKFQPRNLPDGAMVTRFAPSPTGYMHIGGLYQALMDWKLAQQSGGVYMLRIEDTDTKREVYDASRLIVESLMRFGVFYNEGPNFDDPSKLQDIKGTKYGPYSQSQRKDIYHAVAAELLARGLAYPCYLTPDEMDEIREKQKAAGFPTGIYGTWARDRDLTEQEIIVHHMRGERPSIRLYSNGNPDVRIFCRDAVRGSISFPENNEDIVIIKSNDGLPTYHFAHLVDDYFMRTTHVIRGEEWLPSFPLHVQMFNMMGWTPPAYIHTSTIDKIDEETGKQRKLSKRKDPEANVALFLEQGWPIEAVKNYLYNIMASGFEEEKAKKPDTTIETYDLRIKKIPTSGALFDWKKLEWWAREFIATMQVEELVDRIKLWASVYNKEWFERIVFSGEYLKNILGIERDNPKRIRKDFITWKQTLEEVAYFFDDLFQSSECKVQSAIELDKNILAEFLKTFDINDDKDVWWNKITEIATTLGIKNGDVAMNLRVALTGRSNTPDLYSIMQVMGKDRVKERIGKTIN